METNILYQNDTDAVACIEKPRNLKCMQVLFGNEFHLIFYPVKSLIRCEYVIHFSQLHIRSITRGIHNRYSVGLNSNCLLQEIIPYYEQYKIKKVYQYFFFKCLLLEYNGYCLLFVHIGRTDHFVVFRKIRRSFIIRYNEHVSGMNYKQFTSKSNFAQPVLEYVI